MTGTVKETINLGSIQLNFLLDGEVEDTVMELNPGDKCFIPRGTIHGFTNNHAVPAKALCVLSPASIGPAYFREIAEVINAGGPPDMQRVLAIMQRHGLEPAVPK